jgi:hydroxyethylthiazole kinase-like uncharacterized protein yjeF
VLLCGKGNNAGDTYYAGTQLIRLDYEVTAYQLFPINECSELCKEQHISFLNEGGKVRYISLPEEMYFPPNGLIIDGIFGTGFHGLVEEPIASFIRSANESRIPILSVDIPSGLNGATGEVLGDAIVATMTAFLGLPKTGFFLRDGWNHVGALLYVNFGLEQDYMDSAQADMIMLSPEILKPLMPRIKYNRHKYQAGHVVGLAGSPTMPGAGLLASLACLGSGAGIVHLLYPEGMESRVPALPYELIKEFYNPTDTKTILDRMNSASATFIGPGLGLSSESIELVRAVLPELQKPCVVDADALNILSKNKLHLPENMVLTPHIGEMKRLLKIKEATLDLEFLEQCKAYAVSRNATVILKGGPTFILQPGEPLVVCPRGDPGMATAGSGDVLTGLIASLLAQGLSPYDAARLGVYLHGIAGEFAAQRLTSYCMIASDIINYFPDAFRPINWAL